MPNKESALVQKLSHASCFSMMPQSKCSYCPAGATVVHDRSYEKFLLNCCRGALCRSLLTVWMCGCTQKQDDKNQCWSCIVIFWYQSGICIEDFSNFDTIRVWVFDSIFVSDTIWTYIPSNDLHAWVKLPSYQYGLEWYWPNNNLVIQIFSHLDIPTKHQYLIGTKFFIFTGKSFDTNLLMLLVDTMRSPIY